MRFRRRTPILVLAFAGALLAQQSAYFVYVASEAADKITLVKFGPGGASVDHEFVTGIMPTDRHHYSVCMMDEQLVEIDTRTLKVSRHFVLTKGKEAE